MEDGNADQPALNAPGETPGASPLPKSRQEARAQGAKFYQPGGACHRGHQDAVRRVDSGACTRCHLENVYDWRDKNRQQYRDYQQAYKANKREERAVTQLLSVLSSEWYPLPPWFVLALDLSPRPQEFALAKLRRLKNAEKKAAQTPGTDAWWAARSTLGADRGAAAAGRRRTPRR